MKVSGIELEFEKNGFRSVFSNNFDAYCKITFDHNCFELFQAETELYLKDIAQTPLNIFSESELLVDGFPGQPFLIAFQV